MNVKELCVVNCEMEFDEQQYGCTDCRVCHKGLVFPNKQEADEYIKQTGSQKMKTQTLEERMVDLIYSYY